MRRTIVGSTLVAGLALVCAPLAGSTPAGSTDAPPSSSGGSLTASFDNPELGHMDFTITGANLKKKPGTVASYEGAAIGNTITLSGNMSITRAQGYVSWVSMSAKVGEQSWKWPAAGGSERVDGPRTVTQSFKVSFKVGSSKVYTDWVSAGVTMSVCGGICSGYAADFMITIKKGGGGTSPPPPPGVKPGSPPVVRAYPVDQVLKPATYGWLPYSARDASGKAKVHGILYEGGASVLEGGTKYFIAADGRRWRWKARLAADLKGPLYFCVWGENPAGLKSAKAPDSSCAFLSFLVDIVRVSNNCGGDWGEVGRWAQNAMGNKSTFTDPDTGRSFTVDFSDACDLHDAGYGGYTVVDRINGGTVDYHNWSRERVDKKFQKDMQELCRQQIPPSAKRALLRCIGGGARYQTVRKIGWVFFDANLRKPGDQKEGPRDNG